MGKSAGKRIDKKKFFGPQSKTNRVIKDQGILVSFSFPKGVKQACKLLEEEAREMYPEAVKRLEEAQQAKEAKYNKPKPVDDDDDDGAGWIAAELQKELASERKKKPLFQGTRTEVPGLDWVGMPDPEMDSVKLVVSLMKRAETADHPIAPHCRRLLPVSMTCPAKADNVKKKLETLFEPLFGPAPVEVEPVAETVEDKTEKPEANRDEKVEPSAPKESSDLKRDSPESDEDVKETKKAKSVPTFGIVYRSRHNSDARRDDWIKSVADQIGSRGVVDLKDPQYSIIIEIVKNSLCASVLPHFARFKRYNLHSTATQAME